ncbi:nucleotidyl transferase AbiEii/AbiGii toxin family protein [Myxococcota bacterium]|nr:nucleotidyl transferase AbiEii/AbiGii toxin family protein [Myxococcota bacterium]
MAPARDIGASVRARLLRLAHERGEDFQLVLTRYVNERLLFRLASSRFAGQFVLKGAALFALWTASPHRATRDIDLLGFGDPGEARMRQVFAEILALDVPDDGIRFDPGSLAVGPIRDDQEYGGIRVEFVARIKTAQVRVQVDVGFGDAITPDARMVEFPTMLDFPVPRLRAYPRETVVAEKLNAVVVLGLANSRMKDFFDVRVLARDFDFNGEVLTRAIRATFDRRGTAIPPKLPVGLTPAFADDPTKIRQWSAFLRKTGISTAGPLVETVTAVAAFVETPLIAAANGLAFNATWHAPGPWTIQQS